MRGERTPSRRRMHPLFVAVMLLIAAVAGLRQGLIPLHYLPIRHTQAPRARQLVSRFPDCRLERRPRPLLGRADRNVCHPNHRRRCGSRRAGRKRLRMAQRCARGPRGRRACINRQR